MVVLSSRRWWKENTSTKALAQDSCDPRIWFVLRESKWICMRQTRLWRAHAG